jgi:hypothetical protein
MHLPNQCWATGLGRRGCRLLLGDGEEAWWRRRRCRFRLLGNACLRLAGVACGCEVPARVLSGEMVLEARIERAGMGVVWADLVKAGGSLGRLGKVRVVGDGKRCGCW